MVKGRGISRAAVCGARSGSNFDFGEKQNTSGVCSCVDCSGSCPKPEPWPPLPEPWIIAGYDGLFVVMLSVFVAVSSLFLLALLWKWHLEREGKDLDTGSR